jgi:hypothetical protein
MQTRLGEQVPNRKFLFVSNVFLSGKFATLPLNNNVKRSFELKTESGGIDGVDQQCLIYHYYMPTAGGSIAITITKEETVTIN